METQAIAGSAATGAASSTGAASALGGDDFFQLLIAQLSNQDPMEPTSNQELLNQISSIREIELSTSLSKSLESLAEQQRFASAGSLIGNQVSGADNQGNATEGVVVAVRFDQTGKAMLELEGGGRIALDQVESIMSGESAADGLKGRFVTGVDASDPANSRVVEGVVTGVTTDDADRLVLELDTGETLALADVVDARAASAEEEGGGGLLGLASDLL